MLREEAGRGEYLRGVGHLARVDHQRQAVGVQRRLEVRSQNGIDSNQGFKSPFSKDITWKAASKSPRER